MLGAAAASHFTAPQLPYGELQGFFPQHPPSYYFCSLLCLNTNCFSNAMFDTIDTLADIRTRKRLYPDAVDDLPKNRSTDKRQRLLNDYSQMDSQSSSHLIPSKYDQLIRVDSGLVLSSSKTADEYPAQRRPHQAQDTAETSPDSQFTYTINSQSASPVSAWSSDPSSLVGDRWANSCRDPPFGDVCAGPTADTMDLCESKDEISCGVAVAYRYSGKYMRRPDNYTRHFME